MIDKYKEGAAFTVHLSDEQVKVLKLASGEREALKDILAETIDIVAEKIAEHEERMWTQVYELGGVTEETHVALVKWLSSRIVFTPRSDYDDAN